MYRSDLGWSLVVAAAMTAAACSPPPVERPIVIAHRGASGHLPEHTLAAYALAHGQGADYIEPDLVRTRDGAFICLHDIHLEATTDVEEAFPDRHREDGRWYAADFTLEEIRSLRAHERLPGRFPEASAARFAVPTFEEMIELVQALDRSTGRRTGIYPELKAPSFHRDERLAMEQDFLAIAGRYGYRDPSSPIFVQCFEEGSLEEMRRLGSRLPQIFLLGGEQERPLDAARLAEIAGFADGIGPAKEMIYEDAGLVGRAHAAGLLVHPYTLRADDVHESFATLDAELEALYGEAAVDGLFTDFPDLARRFLDRDD